MGGYFLIKAFLSITNIALALRLRTEIENPMPSKGSWVTESGDYMSIHGTEVHCNYTGHSDAPHNALWKEDSGITADTHYWQFRFPTLTGGAFVGITTENYFAPGYKIKGLFYGYNLSDGSALLVQGFGPKIKSGDVIGMLVTYKNNSTYIEFDHNEKPLGLAFEVPAAELENAYPVVQFSGTGAATCTKALEVPKTKPRYIPVYKGIEGTWKLAEGDGATCTLVAENENSYRATIHVANVLSTRLTHENRIWKATGVMSTRLMPPPHLAIIEKAITDVLESINDIYVDVAEHLHVVGAKDELIWTRYDNIPKPYIGRFPPRL